MKHKSEISKVVKKDIAIVQKKNIMNKSENR